MSWFSRQTNCAPLILWSSFFFSVTFVSRACSFRPHGEPVAALWGPHRRRKTLLWQKMVNTITLMLYLCPFWHTDLFMWLFVSVWAFMSQFGVLCHRKDSFAMETCFCATSRGRHCYSREGGFCLRVGGCFITSYDSLYLLMYNRQCWPWSEERYTASCSYFLQGLSGWKAGEQREKKLWVWMLYVCFNSGALH